MATFRNELDKDYLIDEIKRILLIKKILFTHHWICKFISLRATDACDSVYEEKHIFLGTLQTIEIAIFLNKTLLIRI